MYFPSFTFNISILYTLKPRLDKLFNECSSSKYIKVPGSVSALSQILDSALGTSASTRQPVDKEPIKLDYKTGKGQN